MKYFFRTLYLLITLIITLSLGLIIAGHSPWVLQKSMKRFAPDIGLTYQEVSGNFLEGVEITAPVYQGYQLAERVVFKWNPVALLQKRLTILDLSIEGIRGEEIKGLQAQLGESNRSDETKQEDGLNTYGFALDLNHLLITFDPFVERGVEVTKLQLDLDTLRFHTEALALKELTFVLESNLTDMELQGSVKDKVFHVEESSVILLNVDYLIQLVSKDANDTVTVPETNVTHVEHEETVLPPFFPQSVEVTKLYFRISPAQVKGIDIDHLDATVKDTTITLSDQQVTYGEVSFALQTLLADLSFDATIKENHLNGVLDILTYPKLFETYQVPVRPDALKNIQLAIDATQEKVGISSQLDASALLESTLAEQMGGNIDMTAFRTDATYLVRENFLDINSSLSFDTPYAKGVQVINHTALQEVLQYQGSVTVPKIDGVEGNFTKPLENLVVAYRGDTQGIKGEIMAENLKGHILSEGFTRFDIALETPEDIQFATMTPLPDALKEAKGKLKLALPLKLEDLNSTEASITFSSNLLNIDGKLKPMGNMHFDAETRLSRGSLLTELEENVKWENMFPLHLETSLWQKQLRVNFYNRYIRFQSFYDTDVQNLTAFINHPTLKFTASGNTQEKVWLQAKVTSMERLAESITSLYTMKKPPKVSGDIQIDAVITEMQHASLEVQTPMVSYQVNHQTNKSLQDVSLKMELEDTNMTLNSYHVTHEGITVFATKPSYLRLLESNLTVLPFWVNDAVEVRGYYDLAAKKGQIDTRSERVRVAHTMAEVSAALDITARMEGNATDVSGKVTILEGDILYDLNQKRFASDSDIVIVQDIEETESSPLMENLSINVLVESQKPLVYDKGAMDVKVRPGVGVHKAKYSDLMVLGTVELPKGGSYMFEGKKFVLDQSYIYFTGDMNKPLLDITVKYKALNHEITVTVAGTPAAPNIRFSSVPSLSKEEILSVILFDSEVGAGSHTGDEMMRMMGGAVAKSALSNVGVQLDHLVIGDNNSLEVGKKLTDDITVIYINGEIPKIELMYQHKEHLQSVLGASEESSSYDLIYKKDF